jgi:hypothetical protein
LKPSFVSSNVVAKREFLDLLRVLKDPCQDSLLRQSALELVGMLNRLRGRDKKIVEVARHELFANGLGCAKVELAYSSLISAFLQRSLDALWSFHQMPASKGTSDILLCHAGADFGEFHPVCVIECGMQSKTSREMRKSLRGYAVNYCPLVPVGKYFLGVELLNVDSAVNASIRIKAFYRISNDPRVHEVMLWNQEEGMNLEQMICCLMKAVQLAADHNFRDSHRIESWRVFSRNVAADLSNGIVYKSFDYRDRWEETAPEYRRDASFSCRWIPGCQVYASQNDFTLLSYPLLKGVVLAKNASEFLSIFEELAKLHQEDIVHGDIRAYNMIFDGTGGKLIDFDYSGKHGQRCYPPGFWKELPDTVRHPRVSKDEPMRKEHDCFSLGAVMKMYSCDHSGWKELCEKLQSGKPDMLQCLQDLKSIGSVDLRWTGPGLVNVCSQDAPMHHKTSSPIKHQ